MNRICITSSLFALSALFASAGQAQTVATREQVKAEFARAVRDGDIAPAGEGMTPRQMHPERYGVSPAVGQKTRAEVKAELAEAARTGDLMAGGDLGLKLNELRPEAYAATSIGVAGKTREQVKIELAEAIRSGDIMAAGELGMKLNELYPQRYATVRAGEMLGRHAAVAASAAAR